MRRKRLLRTFFAECLDGFRSEPHLFVAGGKGQVHGVSEILLPPTVEANHLVVRDVKSENIVLGQGPFLGFRENAARKPPVLGPFSKPIRQNGQQTRCRLNGQ